MEEGLTEVNMSEMQPKFKVGDKVVWAGSPGRDAGKIIQGPFTPGVRRVGEAFDMSCFSYVVQFRNGNTARLLGELVLELEDNAWTAIIVLAPDLYEYRIAGDQLERRRKT